MEKSNIINFNDALKEEEIKAYKDIVKLGYIIDVSNIAGDVVNYFEYNIAKYGLVFGDDFVVISNKKEVYKINTDMGDGIFTPDIKTGIYIAKFLDESSDKELQKEIHNYIERNLQLIKELESWYFNDFLKKELKLYTYNPEVLMENMRITDEVLESFEDDKEKTNTKIIDFNKRKK